MTDKQFLQIGSIQISSTMLVLFVSILLALHHGFTANIGNQNTYFLQGLHYFQPDLFARDWLTNETTHYHPYFSWIVHSLYFITPSGWSFGILNSLLNVISIVYIYKIIETIFKESKPLLIFLIVASFIAAAETYSIGGSYIFSRTFQPSTIATFTFIAGLYYFLNSRYLHSGILLAIGGIFHVNFLILGIPLYGAYHLYQRDKFFIRNSLKQLVPSFIVLLLHLPVIIAASLSPDATQARYIFQEIHAPQHYIPMTYLREFLPFYSWHFLAFVIGWKYLPSTPIINKFKKLFIIQFVFITIASILTTVVFIPSVSQLYVWRLAPFSVLIAQIIGSYGIIKKTDVAYKNEFSAKYISLFLIYGGLIYFIWNNHYGWFKSVTLRSLLFLGLTIVVCGFVKKCLQLTSANRLKLQTLILLILFTYAAVIPLREFPNRINLITGLPVAEVSLYNWIDRNISKDALFLIPPHFQNFRLNAKRSIVVDWKSPPIVASEIIEWYNRIEDITNYKGIKSPDDVRAYYEMHTSESLLHVYKKYNCDYIVVHTKVNPEKYSDFKILYSNEKYTIIQQN